MRVRVRVCGRCDLRADLRFRCREFMVTLAGIAAWQAKTAAEALAARANAAKKEAECSALRAEQAELRGRNLLLTNEVDELRAEVRVCLSV